MMNFCSNCGNKLSIGETHCDKCGICLENANQNNNVIISNNSYDKENEKKLNNLKKSKKYAIISFVLAIMPIILGLLGMVLFASAFSLNSIVSDVSGKSFGIVFLLFLFSVRIGIISSVVLAIMSLSLKKNVLAIISLIIDLIPLWLILS